jgi:hypothetical protein
MLFASLLLELSGHYLIPKRHSSMIKRNKKLVYASEKKRILFIHTYFSIAGRFSTVPVKLELPFPSEAYCK